MSGCRQERICPHPLDSGPRELVFPSNEVFPILGLKVFLRLTPIIKLGITRELPPSGEESRWMINRTEIIGAAIFSLLAFMIDRKSSVVDAHVQLLAWRTRAKNLLSSMGWFSVSLSADCFSAVQCSARIANTMKKLMNTKCGRWFVSINVDFLQLFRLQ